MCRLTRGRQREEWKVLGKMSHTFALQPGKSALQPGETMHAICSRTKVRASKYTQSTQNAEEQIILFIQIAVCWCVRNFNAEANDVKPLHGYR